MDVDLTGFSEPSVHGLVHRDDFCAFASEVRAELLAFPQWREMQQHSTFVDRLVLPERQNGITTGTIGDAEPAELVHCRRFHALVKEQAVALSGLVGARAGERISIEMHGMAYGQGSWLSPHTDHSDSDESRIAAWILYLTHPDDGEWGADKGGALRLVDEARGAAASLGPKFNRFAIFAVSPTSTHAIDLVRFDPPWEHCRLALSGWIRTEQRGHELAVYRRTSNWRHLREELGRHIDGSIAMYGIMAKQRAHAGLPLGEVERELATLALTRRAHEAAPEGTAFFRHAAGPKWCIAVVDDAEKLVFMGPARDYHP